MLLRKQASSERDEHIDLTPMVDVVFQLMTFMLFSIQLTGSELDVPKARHGVGVDGESSMRVWVLRPVTADGPARTLLGEDGPEGGEVSLDEVKKAVAASVAQGRRSVVLQADGEVSHGDVLKVAAAVTEIDNVTLHIGVQEPD
jgi:biopolymer transport protein ExbD